MIILQADHGSGWLTIDPIRGYSLSARQATPEQLGERLGIFAAYLFPGADTAVSSDISPVNVLPLVLNALFGQQVDLLPDHSYWSTYQDPLSLTQIPAAGTRPPE